MLDIEGGLLIAAVLALVLIKGATAGAKAFLLVVTLALAMIFHRAAGARFSAYSA
jgi:hypothetical protein